MECILVVGLWIEFREIFFVLIFFKIFIEYFKRFVWYYRLSLYYVDNLFVIYCGFFFYLKEVFVVNVFFCCGIFD